jgi:hypothetical protein
VIDFSIKRVPAQHRNEVFLRNVMRPPRGRTRKVRPQMEVLTGREPIQVSVLPELVPFVEALAELLMADLDKTRPK